MKKITGYIRVYSRKARDRIITAGEKFLRGADIEYLSSDLFSCADELIKNAVKANYKFLLIRDRIFQRIADANPGKSHDEIEQEIDGLLKIQESFDYIADSIVKSEDITSEVREILNEEGRLINIKNRAYKEGRDLTREEKEALTCLTKLNNIRERTKETGTKIILNIQGDDDFIYIEITNTAPILTRDLNRIYEKREEHQRYVDRGEAYKFFINNLDNSESGFGLGYATIDSIISSWGLDTERTVTIISSINTTVMITLPIAELRKRAVA